MVKYYEFQLITMENQSKVIKTIPVSTRLPETLYRKLENYAKERDYANISEAIRGILREVLNKKLGSSPHSDMVGEEGDKRCRG